MRALAVVNPKATAMNAHTRDAVLRTLERECKTEIVETSGPGNASELAATAAGDGLDVVVAVGGDGTVNEVVNGLLRDGIRADVPRLAVVPGGSANVFARNLGLHREPMSATAALVERLRGGGSRTIGLGRIELDDASRWFTFCAGFGLDAEVVREVQRRRRAGARAAPGLYARVGVREYLRTDRRHPALTVEADAADGAAADVDAGRGTTPGSIGHVFTAIVTNTTPWTYFGRRPFHLTPAASFDTGLDAVLLRDLGPLSTAAKIGRLLAGHAPGNRRQVSIHDTRALRLLARRPVAVEVDGEYVGEYAAAQLHAVPAALTVIA